MAPWQQRCLRSRVRKHREEALLPGGMVEEPPCSSLLAQGLKGTLEVFLDFSEIQRLLPGLLSINDEKLAILLLKSCCGLATGRFLESVPQTSVFNTAKVLILSRLLDVWNLKSCPEGTIAKMRSYSMKWQVQGHRAEWYMCDSLLYHIWFLRLCS